jgi:hypothetical protein
VGRQSEAIGRALRAELGKLCKMLALEIDKELRKSTPVDTGHARANWVPSVGSPHVGEVEQMRVARNVGSTAHANGVAQVLRFKLGDGDLYISNAVPYVPVLNLGWSDQAPRLWIEMAIDRAIATVSARYAGRAVVDRASFLGQTAGGRELLGGELAGNLADAYSPFD